MATITSGDGVASCSVVMNQDADGVYAIAITSMAPTNAEMAIEVGGNRVWQDQARSDAQA